MWKTVVIIGLWSLASLADRTTTLCDTVEEGYTCSPSLSQHWGQYSPYFTIPSNVSDAIPPQCSVTFAHILSRHGARYPTSDKGKAYKALFDKIHHSKPTYNPKVAFFEHLTYELGQDDLTAFGQQELYNSGVKFFNRYTSLSNSRHLIVRSSREARVVQSALNFTIGFHDAMKLTPPPNEAGDYPYNIILTGPKADTLNVGQLCAAFVDEKDVAARGSKPWSDNFAPDITKYLNGLFAGADLDDSDTINFMDLCPFYTVADQNGAVATQFCDLFSESQWESYDYYQTLGKFYRYGAGDPLGPSQGVGWTNELIARLNNTPVRDHTTVNHTLDSNQATFPTGPDAVLFADFSHDVQLTSIFFAMGLYNVTSLSHTKIEPAESVCGYSAAWSVPFSARMYVEKLSCAVSGDTEHEVQSEDTEDFVRVIVNDRVMPLSCVGNDPDGKCKLTDFIATLSWAQVGGDWAQCNKTKDNGGSMDGKDSLLIQQPGFDLLDKMKM